MFSRGHATLHLAVSVGRSVDRSVGPSVRHIFEFRAVFALLLLPKHPRLDCRVSGLVYLTSPKEGLSIHLLVCPSGGLSIFLFLKKTRIKPQKYHINFSVLI